MAEPVEAKLIPSDLRCEYKTNPVAIDSATPRLFWIVSDSIRGDRQTAYRILVASTRAKLDSGQGDLWDTGKVASSETIQIPYAGNALKSGQQAFWKVCVWDKDGKLSPWSQPANWTVGLQAAGDWTAKWIGPQPLVSDTAKPSLGDAKWIWFAGDGEKVPVTKRYFQGALEVPAGSQITRATLSIAADDECHITLNGKSLGAERSTDTWRDFKTFDVTKEVRSGSNAIALEVANTESGPAGVIARLVVKTANGQEFVCVTNEGWKAAQTASGTFTPVHVLGANGVQPWGTIASHDRYKLTPPPYFRKGFTTKQGVRRAVLYATALGVYQLSVNGKRVSNDVLSPGWADFRSRVHYVAYDVTPLIRPGKNALGAILGDGWYASYLAFTGKRHFYGGDPQLRLQLRLEYADGSQETIGTDESWKTQYGAIQSADMLMGSTIDTRKEEAGWDTGNFSDTAWASAVVAPDPKIAVDLQPNEPIRPTGKVAALKRTEPSKGVFIYDMGQNMVGWVHLTVNGKPGQVITVRHGERLNPDGTLYTTNLRSAKATDTYILRGGPQTLEPIFTFHGFQYVEISGNAAPLAPSAVTGIVASSDLKSTLAFDSDNPLLNKLIKNIDWGFRGNSLDVPTDCPQRDERAGWMGDAQVFAKTAMFHRDAAPFYTKWLIDVRDGQMPDGAYPDVAPSIIGNGNAAWEDAGVICTYRMWEMYGDTEIIRQSWPSMLKFMDHLAKISPGDIRPVGAFGDWLLLAGPDKSPIHGTAYYYRSAQLMAEMAKAIGNTQDATRFTALAAEIRSAFMKRFVTADGHVQDGGQESQTFYALALEWGLLEPAQRPMAVKYLTDMIDKQGGHLTTGFIGTPVLLPALASAGRSDVANALLVKDTYPSWLYQVKLGSTTMWERWDGWTPEKGFQDPGMNSFNHYWLGCVGEWIYTGVAGIDTEGAGWSKITVHPHIEGTLKQAHVRYDSIRGVVDSHWSKDGAGKLTLTVTIPSNTTATVYVPKSAKDAVYEGTSLAASTPGIKLLREEEGAAVYSVPSGHYIFKVVPAR